MDDPGEQFIVELKIWWENEWREKQLSDYLDYYHKDKGDLLGVNETVI